MQETPRNRRITSKTSRRFRTATRMEFPRWIVCRKRIRRFLTCGIRFRRVQRSVQHLGTREIGTEQPLDTSIFQLVLLGVQRSTRNSHSRVCPQVGQTLHARGVQRSVPWGTGRKNESQELSHQEWLSMGRNRTTTTCVIIPDRTESAIVIS